MTKLTSFVLSAAFLFTGAPLAVTAAEVKVASDQSIHVRYVGKPLVSRQRCFLK